MNARTTQYGTTRVMDGEEEGLENLDYFTRNLHEIQQIPSDYSCKV